MHVGLFFICKSVGGLPLFWTAHTQEQDGATTVPVSVTSTLLIPLSKRTGLDALTLAPSEHSPEYWLLRRGTCGR